MTTANLKRETTMTTVKKLSDRVRCFSVELERVFSGTRPVGTPVLTPEGAVETCLERGGPGEAAEMAAEVERLKGAYPDWSARVQDALADRFRADVLWATALWKAGV
jgi:hypothetical protein